MRLHEEPTINEVVGSVIAVLAVGAIVFLAIDGNAAAQTALVSVAGAAAGTYYSNTKGGNGNVSGKTGGPNAPGPQPGTPNAPKA